MKHRVIGNRCMIFSKDIIVTSAVSSTTLGSILIFASCVLLLTINRSPVFKVSFTNYTSSVPGTTGT